MSNEFWRYIGGVGRTEPKLPVMHTTDGFGLRAMANSRQLATRECDVFNGEKLAYLFYGRPSYRPHHSRDASKQLLFAPVCVILDPDTPVSYKRAYPFDTGAYAGGLYDRHFHPDMGLESFLLPSDVSAAQSVVAKFYVKNLAYFRGSPVDDLKIEPGEFEVDCYYKLICDDSEGMSDDRCSAIELQASEFIDLDKSNVLAIICPTDALEMTSVVEAMNAWDVEPYTYELHRGSTREYQGLVYEKTENFLDARDLI